MNANGLLDLARFFVSFSENNSDTSLCVWREGDSFRFHLTNNNRGQKGTYSSTAFSPATSAPLFPSTQPSPDFSTPPPAPGFSLNTVINPVILSDLTECVSPETPKPSRCVGNLQLCTAEGDDHRADDDINDQGPDDNHHGDPSLYKDGFPIQGKVVDFPIVKTVKSVNCACFLQKTTSLDFIVKTIVAVKIRKHIGMRREKHARDVAIFN